MRFVSVFSVLFVLFVGSVASCHGDGREPFAVQYGESDDELHQLGRGWVCWYLYGPVWQDFDELDPYVVIVQPAYQFVHDLPDRQCVLLTVPNPGWRGHRGNKATIQWDHNLWHQHRVLDAKLVQLRTSIR